MIGGLFLQFLDPGGGAKAGVSNAAIYVRKLWRNAWELVIAQNEIAPG